VAPGLTSVGNVGIRHPYTCDKYLLLRSREPLYAPLFGFNDLLMDVPPPVPVRSRVQLPPLSLITSNCILPTIRNNRLPPLNQPILRLPSTLPPVPTTQSRPVKLPCGFPITPKSQRSESSSVCEGQMDVDEAGSHYSGSPLPSPVHTRFPSPATTAHIDDDMRHSLRNAERAFFADPEPGTCGSPMFSHASSPSTSSSLASSSHWGSPQLPSASPLPRPGPAGTSHPRDSAGHGGFPSGSTRTAPYAQLGPKPSLSFPVGLLPPPPNQSARRAAQGSYIQRPSMKGKEKHGTATGAGLRKRTT